MKAYSGAYGYAFMSYSHKDEEKIRPLVGKLQSVGCNIWYDEGILPADEWAETIAKKLAGASLFFLILSRNSAASQNVRREIYYAVSNNLPILTFYIEDVELSQGLAMQLGISQSVRTENNWEKDIEAIRAVFPKDAVCTRGNEPEIFYHGTRYLYAFSDERMNEYSIIRINRKNRERTTLFSHKDSSAFFGLYRCDRVHFSPRDEFNSEERDILYFSVWSDLDSDIGTSAPNLYVQVDFAVVDPDKEQFELRIIGTKQKRKEAPFSETQVTDGGSNYWTKSTI